MTAMLFLSSGDLTADRRYDYGRDLQARGDDVAAADLFAQAAEIAPHFASAWFALAECRERLDQHTEAIAAYRAALSADPSDRHGALVRLMRLEAEPLAEMPESYVRGLFDQYAPRFEQALVKELKYRAPELLRQAVLAVQAAVHGPFRFARAIDLGCGTGLAGRAFAPNVDELVGVDLSPQMIAQARLAGGYATLETGDMLAFLRAEAAASADLVIAADAMVYVADLCPLMAETARVLRSGGVVAFTVETHDGSGVRIGAGLRYMHAETYVRAVLGDAALKTCHLAQTSTRIDKGQPVPGLIVVAIKPVRRVAAAPPTR